MRESARIRTRGLSIDACAIEQHHDHTSPPNPPPIALLERLMGRLAWGVVLALAVVVTVANCRQHRAAPTRI